MEELRVLQAVRLDNATPTERLLQLRLRQRANPSRSARNLNSRVDMQAGENTPQFPTLSRQPQPWFLERCRLGRAT